LPAALDALESDEVASGWLDPVLLRTYLAVKRSEVAHVSALDEVAMFTRVTDVY
jgi:glutamine synthetase